MAASGRQSAKPTGRPTKLTSEVHARIVQAIQAGNYMETAAAYAGISKTTFFEWLRRGARERERLAKDQRARPSKREAPYAEFAVAVEQALAAAEVRDVALIAKAAEKEWTAAAWRLERKFPAKWGRRIAVDEGEKRNTARSALVEMMQRLREEAGDDGAGPAEG